MNTTVHVCLRRVPVWLLLAIPFQGIAAAGMLACTHAAMPHGGVTAMAAMSAPQQIDGGASHCHDAGAQVATHAAGSGTAPAGQAMDARKPGPKDMSGHEHH